MPSSCAPSTSRATAPSPTPAYASSWKTSACRTCTPTAPRANVTFRVPIAEDPATTAHRIETHLTDTLGHPVGVFLRTGRQMRTIAEATPFPQEVIAASRGVLQALLLDRRPNPAERDQVLALQTAYDLLAFGDMELYWLPVAGDAQPARWSSPGRSTR